MDIRTVLCPVDFSELDHAEIELAAEVCRAFGAHLLLHHDLATVGDGEDARWRLHALASRLADGLTTEELVTVGPVAEVLFGLVERRQVDLLVMGSHGVRSPAHASVTGRLMDGSRCAVLAFEERADRPRFRLVPDHPGEARVVVPTDLTTGSIAVVEYAFALARRIPFSLDLLHVVEPGNRRPDRMRRAEGSLRALVPADLRDRVTIEVRCGPPAAVIAECVEERQPGFCVLGEHAHGWFRHFFTRDTTREVVHRVDCPIWVVPPRRPR